VTGWAEDVASGCRLIAEVRPDIVVLDINLRGDDKGIDVLHYVKRAQICACVVIFSSHVDPVVRPFYINAGASQCFNKASEFRQLCTWIGGG
jgi:DNA-binding NarL/FixJ family response regulator